MTPEALDLESWLERSGALQRGHFRLSSGRHSSAYVQCALLLEVPHRAKRLAKELAARIEQFRPDSILSPALGGLIIGHEVAAALGVPFRFTERSGDQMCLRRGFRLTHGERLVVVEDVVTTGRSSRETARLAAAAGARVLAVAALLDRSGGGHRFEIPFLSLLELELPIYLADRCPLCEAGIDLTSPGSRPVS